MSFRLSAVLAAPTKLNPASSCLYVISHRVDVGVGFIQLYQVPPSHHGGTGRGATSGTWYIAILVMVANMTGSREGSSNGCAGALDSRKKDTVLE